MTWSPEEDSKLLRMWLRDSCTQREIADHLEKSTSSVSRRVGKLGVRGERGNVKLYMELEGEAAEPKLQPVQVELPKREPTTPEPAQYMTVHWGDVQIPFQDPRAEDVFFQILQDVQPRGLYAMGDILDCWQISDYRPPDERNMRPDQLNIQDNIEATATHLMTAQLVSGAQDLVFFEGNHEERWTRMLRDLQTNYKYRNLMQIPRLQEALSLEYLLGLEDSGWDYLDYTNDQPIVLNDRLVLLHGYKNNKWVTRSMLDEFGKSTLFCHGHRIQNFTRSDLNGTNSAWMIGSLCEPVQHYGEHGAGYGHQGFAVVSWCKDGDAGWLFDVEQVRIHDGRAVWRGREYRA